MARLSVFVACPYRLFPMDDYKKMFAGVRTQGQRKGTIYFTNDTDLENTILMGGYSNS
jgi:hypothetical protein